MTSSSFINHLRDEKSPYLLQHVHNPVDWYPWGQEAFAKAVSQQKPVLLSVGYSTCHWCHVMAHESFEDQGIAQFINDYFVAIKVDREERPDIDHIYMTATTAMTGQGGWPLTVFLTPQGEPFYGGTYFPPYAKWGSVGFMDLLQSIALGWSRDRENILTSGRSITEDLKRHVQSKRESISQTDMALLLDRAFEQLKQQFDPQNGGFGHAPKFPMGHNLSFLLRYAKRSQSTEALAMSVQTLKGMRAGGIWDHLGGGFHRYSTDEYWHVPHFEKMLYDQALLSRAYVEAYQLTGELEFAQTARGILDYVLEEMTDPLGGFYSAQDADSLDEGGHLKEGAYYVFGQDEIIEVLGQAEAAIFNYHFGVLPQGNARVDPHGEFTAKNILAQAHTLRETAEEFHRQIPEIQGILKRGIHKLLDKWKTRPRPYLDDKVLCDWNGLMVASLALAGEVLAESKYKEAALKAADFISSHMMRQGRLLHRWRQGQAAIQATLDDYSFLVLGLLAVYEATLEEKYLKQAVELADRMISLFTDPAGGFFMTAVDAESLIFRPKDIYDGAIPSGNSVAAYILGKLHVLTGKEIYLKQLEASLNGFASTMAQAPYAYCFMLAGVDNYVQGPLEITLEGRREDAVIKEIRNMLNQKFLPDMVLKFNPTDTKAQAQICRQGRCGLPMVDPLEFEKELKNL